MFPQSVSVKATLAIGLILLATGCSKQAAAPPPPSPVAVSPQQSAMQAQRPPRDPSRANDERPIPMGKPAH